jgi:phosphate starvation-inducible protein PhoH and related proteins
MRQQRKSQKRTRAKVVTEEYFFEEYKPRVARVPPKLVAKTENQKKYIAAIQAFKLIFGLGPAGTGKTHIATSLAAEWLATGKIDKFIITRPAVEAGESLGFLPGELEEKYAPYLAPVIQILNDYFGKSHVENLLKLGKIEAVPLGFMRGMTFRNCVVLLDEAQNVTKKQMKMFLTRIGEGCTVIVDGDAAQVDIPDSGLVDAVKRLQHIPAVKIIQFSRQDIVRDDIVAEIIEAYDQ